MLVIKVIEVLHVHVIYKRSDRGREGESGEMRDSDDEDDEDDDFEEQEGGRSDDEDDEDDAFDEEEGDHAARKNRAASSAKNGKNPVKFKKEKKQKCDNDTPAKKTSKLPLTVTPHEIPNFIHAHVTREAVALAVDLYKQHGFVIIRVADAVECKNMIREQWHNIICKQGFIDRLHSNGGQGGPVVKLDNGNVTTDEIKILGILQSSLTPENLTEFENHWTQHSAFGASCDPQSMHMPGVWKHRQNEKLYEFAKSVTGASKLWADLNRCIHKLPKKGDKAFLHWDCDPRFEKDKPLEEFIQGKLMWTDSQFIAVPGSHTNAVMKEYCEKFKKGQPTETKRLEKPSPSAKIPNARSVKKPNPKAKTPKPVAKWNIRTDPESDPLKFWDQQVRYLIPAGCVVFWSNKLVHGHTVAIDKNPIEWGMYIGYLPAVSRDEYDRVATNKLKLLSNTKITPLIWTNKTELDQKQNERYKVFEGVDEPPVNITEGEAYGYETQLTLVKHALQVQETELADRVRSFVYNCAPMLWPSNDPIHYFENQFRSTGGPLWKRIRNCCEFTPGGGAQVMIPRQPFVAYQRFCDTDPKMYRMPMIVPTFSNGGDIPAAVLTDTGVELLGITHAMLAKVRSDAASMPIKTNFIPNPHQAGHGHNGEAGGGGGWGCRQCVAWQWWR